MTEQPTQRVTKQDVLAALGDTDPSRTNANIIRARLGRGGNSTIQKLLNEIRAERSAPAKSIDSEAPPPPAPIELIATVWQACWLQAQAQTLSRLDKTNIELAQLKESSSILTNDYEALCDEVDNLRDALAAAEQTTAAAEAELRQVTAEHAAEINKLQLELDEANAALKAAKLELTQSHELMQRDSELKDLAHRNDREHLLNQLAELKALLYRGEGKATA